jgi:hypothetical protein
MDMPTVSSKQQDIHWTWILAGVIVIGFVSLVIDDPEETLFPIPC